MHLLDTGETWQVTRSEQRLVAHLKPLSNQFDNAFKAYGIAVFKT